MNSWKIQIGYTIALATGLFNVLTIMATVSWPFAIKHALSIV
jgi:hypothetical protein